MSTPIADMVAQMLAAGVPADVIVLAVRTAETTASRVDSRVDKTAENRRAWDRQRRAEKRLSTRNPPDSGGHENPALLLKKEKKEEIEKGRKKERTRKHPLPPDFQPKPSHYQAAVDLNLPESAVLEKAEDMRIWAQASGELKADWDATLHGFMRRDAKRSRGPPYAAETSNGFLAVHRELRERMDAQHGNDEPDEQAGGPDEGERRLF